MASSKFLPTCSRKLMEIYFSALRNAPCCAQELFLAVFGGYLTDDPYLLLFPCPAVLVVVGPRGRIGRWHREIRQMARENLTANGVRSLATSRSGIDVNLRVGYNVESASEEKKAIRPICSQLTMERQTANHLNPDTNLVILKRETRNTKL